MNAPSQCLLCAGFPTRKAIRPFAQRYKLLLRGASAGAVIADMTDEVDPAVSNWFHLNVCDMYGMLHATGCDCDCSCVYHCTPPAARNVTRMKWHVQCGSRMSNVKTYTDTCRRRGKCVGRC